MHRSSNHLPGVLGGAAWIFFQLVLGSPARGQSPSEIEELKQQMRVLQERVAQLEMQQQQQIREAPSKEAALVSKALERKPTPPALQTLYDDGFWFVGPDDKLKIGGTFQWDGRFLGPDNPAADTFQARRARIFATGVLENQWGYMLMPRWDRGVPSLHQAWLEYQGFSAARLRLGQFKEPYSLEALNSDQYLDFNERSLWVSNLLQVEDIGAMVHGKIWDQRLEYGLGIFNGRGSNRDDTNDGKEIAGQIALLPFGSTENGWLKGMILSLSGSVGDLEADLANATYRTAAQTVFWRYAPDVVPNGQRQRFSAEIEWPIGPASFKGGMHRAILQDLEHAGLERDITIDGWNLSASYLLTGEKKPRNRPVIPDVDFDSVRGTWGAVELAVRYEQFLGEREPFEMGFFTGTPGAESLTFGVNWYLNRHMRAMFDVQQTWFDDPITVGGETIDEELSFLFRFQMEF